MSESPMVALHGFVYSTNFGDMLLCRLTADIVRRQLPGVRLSLPFASPTFRCSAEIECDTGVSSFLSADALLYHGGGYFAFSERFDPLSRTRLYKRFYVPGLAATALRKPYGIFGVGVGPIRSSFQSRAVRRVFQGAAVITVRDEEGRDWLRRIGINHGDVDLAADLATSLDWKDVPPEAVRHADRILAEVPGETRIGVHVSAPSHASREYAAVIGGIVDYANRHPEIGFVLLCDHLPPRAPKSAPQYLAAVELARQLGGQAKFIGQPPLWTLVAVLGKLNGLITNKLHAGIVSSAFGRRVVSIAKNEKNFRFFRQIDAQSRCMRLADATTADIPGFLERGFESLHVSTPIPAAVKALAKKNELLIGRFLNTIAV